MAKRAGIEWKSVDTESFPADLKSAHKKRVDAYNAYEEAKMTFDSKAKDYLAKQKMIPEGKVAAFNYTGTALLIGFIEPTRTSERDQFSFG